MAGRLSSPASADETAAGPAETRPARAMNRDSAGESRATKASDRRGADREKRDSAANGGAAGHLIALENIVRGENSLDRSRALLDYLDKLPPGEFQDAIAYFRSLGITESRMGEYSLMMTAWAEADPTAALAYAKDNTGGGFARDTILTTWATRDPDAAIRWAQANFEGDGPNPYMAGIIRGISGTDPARATELLTSMPRSQERGQGLEYLLPGLLSQGADKTRDWISSLDDDSLKNGAMLRVADKLANEDPSSTASWLLANPGEAANRRIDDVFGIWASSDQQAALRSLGALPAGEARSDALRGVVSSVATSDPQQALSLMDRYPADVTDRTVENFVWHSFGDDPSAAVNGIARIGDDKQRDRMYRRTLEAWMGRDAESAQRWMATNPVPESVQADLLRRQANRQGKE